MKGSNMTKNLQLSLMLLTLLVAGLDRSALAQTPTASQRPVDSVKTDSRMLYHDGPIMAGALMSISSGTVVGTTTVVWPAIPPFNRS